MLVTPIGQLFLLVGVILSGFALGDCSFVRYDRPFVDELPEFIETFGNQKLGFFTFALPNGECYWYTSGDAYDQFVWYTDNFVGDWHVARGFSSAAFIIGMILFLYSMAFVCLSHFGCCRYVFAWLCFVMATFQGLSLLVLGTDMCNERDCQLGRAGILSITATCMYFVAGVFFFLQTDYSNRPFQDNTNFAEKNTISDRRPEAPLPKDTEHIPTDHYRENPDLYQVPEIAAVNTSDVMAPTGTIEQYGTDI